MPHLVLAAHAAAAIMASRHSENLRSGIVVERCDVDDVPAFDMLRRLSQESNTAFVDIAQRVIATRSKPSTPSSAEQHLRHAGERSRQFFSWAAICRHR